MPISSGASALKWSSASMVYVKDLTGQKIPLPLLLTPGFGESSPNPTTPFDASSTPVTETPPGTLSKTSMMSFTSINGHKNRNSGLRILIGTDVPSSATSPTSNTPPLPVQKTLLVFLSSSEYSPTFLAHLKYCLAKDIRVIFFTSQTRLSHVKNFIKSFVIFLKAEAQANQQNRAFAEVMGKDTRAYIAAAVMYNNPLPGKLYLDTSKKLYRFFGIVDQSNLQAAAFKQGVSSSHRQHGADASTHSPAATSAASPNAYLRQNSLKSNYMSISASIRDWLSKKTQKVPSLPYPSGLVMLEGQKLLYRYICPVIPNTFPALDSPISFEALCESIASSTKDSSNATTLLPDTYSLSTGLNAPPSSVNGVSTINQSVTGHSSQFGSGRGGRRHSNAVTSPTDETVFITPAGLYKSGGSAGSSSPSYGSGSSSRSSVNNSGSLGDAEDSEPKSSSSQEAASNHQSGGSGAGSGNSGGKGSSGKVSSSGTGSKGIDSTAVQMSVRSGGGSGGSSSESVSHRKQHEKNVFMMSEYKKIIRQEKIRIQPHQQLLVDPSKQVGVGRYATVYKSTWLGINVAVKYFNRNSTSNNPNSSPTEEETDRLITFSNEVSILMALNNQHIVNMLGFGVIDGKLYVVEEFMERGSLFDVISRIGSADHLASPADVILTPAVKKRMLLGIADGMAYLHSCSPKFIHQDLKSLNILVSSDWRPIIADFGIAREMRGDEKDLYSSSGSSDSYYSYSEQAHHCGGTFPWMCPEQLLLVTIPTTKWDVFGFGIIAWELATRSKPWFGSTRRQVLERVLSGQRPPIPAGNEQWCKELRHLISDCWNQEPSKRPEFRTILKRLASDTLVMPF